MKLYLYLARRDKTDIRVLTVFSSTTMPAGKNSRIRKISDLNLPESLRAKIEAEVYSNRMLWELWMESAEDYNVLQKQLTKRGFRNVPHHPSYSFSTQIDKITPSKNKVVSISPPPVRKSMLRRSV
jgi:hypothetical protein